MERNLLHLHKLTENEETNRFSNLSHDRYHDNPSCILKYIYPVYQTNIHLAYVGVVIDHSDKAL